MIDKGINLRYNEIMRDAMERTSEGDETMRKYTASFGAMKMEIFAFTQCEAAISFVQKNRSSFRGKCNINVYSHEEQYLYTVTVNA